MQINFKKKFNSYYDGTPPVDPPADPPAPPVKTFTQEEVDKIVQGRVSKMKDENTKTLTQLQALQKSKTLSDTERTSLATRIEELQTSLMTKEELAQREKMELENKFKTDLEATSKERDDWKGRFTKTMVQRSLLDAAVSGDAFQPSQLMDLLEGKTQLVENNGAFEVKIRFQGRDKEGKPMEMILSPEETITEMKKMTDKFGNLFKSGATGGAGGGASAGTVNLGMAKDINTYIQQRAQIRGKK
jgi:hypothetical protein